MNSVLAGRRRWHWSESLLVRRFQHCAKCINSVVLIISIGYKLMDYECGWLAREILNRKSRCRSIYRQPSTPLRYAIIVGVDCQNWSQPPHGNRLTCHKSKELPNGWRLATYNFRRMLLNTRNGDSAWTSHEIDVVIWMKGGVSAFAVVRAVPERAL